MSGARSLARHAPLLLLLLVMALAAVLYLPGLNGPWLLDDFYNLGPFLQHATGNAPYRDIIFSNPSGPLGRSVAMASFAANHALGLFDTAALKATNLALHLVNGLLLFALLHALFTRRPPTTRLAPALLAAILAGWWLLLPLHISTVLYIVQRMTELATLFSLATALAFVHGRIALPAHPGRALALIGASLFLCFPLALFAKESAATILASLVLIELFFFQTRPVRPVLTLLALILLASFVVLALAPPDRLANAYLGREFSLAERLLSQPRALWSYAHSLFLPGGGSVGVFHDDFLPSRSLTLPATTLPALLGLIGLVGLALRQADSSRWWPVAFGLAFFLAGHLIESTFISLELYFEHRNYLPSAGLLLAVAVIALNAWPARLSLLAVVAGLYLALIATTTAQRTFIWGNEALLLETSVINHPHSVGAVTNLGEYLFERDPAHALQTVAKAAEAAPASSDVLSLQLLSMYCRLGMPPPAPLIRASANALGQPRNAPLSIRIGLTEILAHKQQGHCGNADFSPLVPALLNYDRHLVQHYGPLRRRVWNTRLALGEWLLELDQTGPAVQLLDDIWTQGSNAHLPLVGLALASARARAGDGDGLRQTLRELDSVTADAPPDFQEKVNRLRPVGPQEQHD